MAVSGSVVNIGAMLVFLSTRSRKGAQKGTRIVPELLYAHMQTITAILLGTVRALMHLLCKIHSLKIFAGPFESLLLLKIAQALKRIQK